MDNGLLQALMMGMGGAGAGAGTPGVVPPAAESGGMFGNGGMSPQLMQFASGALGGGFQGGVGKLMGGLLMQKVRQRMQQQANPADQLLSGDPGAGGQPMA